MTATVVWSPNLRLAVKGLKTVAKRDFLDEQKLTATEEQAIQIQLLQKTKDVSAKGYWN